MNLIKIYTSIQWFKYYICSLLDIRTVDFSNLNRQKKKQVPKMKSKNHLKQSNQHPRSPSKFKRQLFITHLNLSSSSSFNKISKNSPHSIKPWNTNSKIKQDINLPQQQKIKILPIDGNEQVMSFTQSQIQKKSEQVVNFTEHQSQKNSQNAKSSLTFHKKLGQWIKPKASKTKDQYLFLFQRKKKEIDEQKQQIKNENQPQGIQNQNVFQPKQSGSLSSYNQSKDDQQDNQSGLAQQGGANEQSNPVHSEKQKFHELYFEQQRKTNKKHIPEQLSYSIKLTPSHSSNFHHQLLSTNKTQGGSIFCQLSPKQANKKYSNFQILLKEKNSRLQKSITKRFPTKQKMNHQTQKHSGSFSPKQSTEKINCHKQELLPSHFSYKSPINYLQNYRIYAGNPQKLMKSMNDLRKINDEEHEYFKYERMQKQLMYYKNDSGISSLMTQRSFSEVEKEVKMIRRVKYDNFIKELQNKMLNRKIDDLTSSQNFIDLQSSSSDFLTLEENLHNTEQRAYNKTVSCLKFIPQDHSKRYGKVQRQYEPQENGSKSSNKDSTPQQNQSTIFMFQKSKTKVKKLQEQLDRAKQQEKKFFLQFQRIGQQYQKKMATRMERVKSLNIFPKG